LLTLSALVLAIAIVVDDAIVVVEAVHAKLDQGYKSSKQAAIDAMNEITSALISITLVMMLVFIPVSFMGGTTGVFYRQFGLTMAMAIGLSAVNALTLSPALCAIFLKPHATEEDSLDESAPLGSASHKPSRKNVLQRFFYWFNVIFDATLAKYKKGAEFFIHHKVISFIITICAIGALVFLMNITPTGMVPEEDTGTIMGVVSMPPGTSMERTEATMDRLDSIMAKIDAIDTHTAITGYSFIGGQGNSYGSFIIKLKPWEERDESQSADAVVGQLFQGAAMQCKDATAIFFKPPMVSGSSVTSGFEIKLLDKTGGSLDKFYTVYQSFIQKLNACPEIQMAYSTFNPTFPQYLVTIDVAKVKKAGLSQSDILSALQGYYGGMYISNFNKFGKLYRVMMQAEPEARVSPETLKKIKVRNGSEMAPIDNFVSLSRVYGPDVINRFNMYTSIAVTGNPAAGVSSGDAIKAIERVAAETLPTGYSYDYSGNYREEAQSSGGSTTGYVFMLVLLFVYLILSAQYESYALPWAVILSVPFGLMGTFIFAQLRDISNNIYLQIALIMLIGLLAKNAILIVEFALERRRTGMSIVNAAIQGAVARLRPILMTSLAMIIGLLPMMFADGAGANGNQALGTGAVGGMLIGMIFQLFIVPALFVVFQHLQEKISPIKWEDMDNTGITSEIEQYSIK
jgi:HAE1 family hydrophobic/amphiphilic exporter-1